MMIAVLGMMTVCLYVRLCLANARAARYEQMILRLCAKVQHLVVTLHSVTLERNAWRDAWKDRTKSLPSELTKLLDKGE